MIPPRKARMMRAVISLTEFVGGWSVGCSDVRDMIVEAPPSDIWHQLQLTFEGKTYLVSSEELVQLGRLAEAYLELWYKHAQHRVHMRD